MEADDVLLRVDFVREVAELLQEVRAEQREVQSAQGLDPESVAAQLKQQEKQQTIRQVESLLKLAINLQWWSGSPQAEKLCMCLYFTCNVLSSKIEEGELGLSRKTLYFSSFLSQCSQALVKISIGKNSVLIKLGSNKSWEN